VWGYLIFITILIGKIITFTSGTEDYQAFLDEPSEYPLKMSCLAADVTSVMGADWRLDWSAVG
jgi:hypothetical protein